MRDVQEHVEAKIASLLASALSPGSPNEIRADQLREWTIEYLQDWDDEVARFPEVASSPHWNLFMMDARIEDALFAVLIFRASGIEILSGTSDAFAIKRFAENDFPDNIGELLAEMAILFAVQADVLRLSREDAELWLGRSWQP